MEDLLPLYLVCTQLGPQWHLFVRYIRRPKKNPNASHLDIITSLALIVADQQQTFNMGGVSRTLDISYLRPIPKGKYFKISLSSHIRSGSITFLLTHLFNHSNRLCRCLRSGTITEG